MKKPFIVGAAVVVAAAAAAAPYLVGLRFEDRFRRYVAAVSEETGRPIEIVSYDRDWLGARAVTRIDAEGHSLALHHRIAHGPFATFGWAEVETTPEYGSGEAHAAYYFDGPAFTLTTHAGFDGSVDIDVVSPAFEKPPKGDPDALISWGGLEGHIGIDGNQVALLLNMPSLEVTAPGKSLSITGVELAATGSTMKNLGKEDATIDWDGQTSFVVERFRIKEPTRNIDAELSFEWFLASGLDEAGDYGITSKIRLYDAVVAGAVVAGAVDGESPVKIEDAVLTIALGGIPAAPLEELLVEMQAVDSRYSPPLSDAETRALETQAQALLALYAPRLLAGKPRVTVDIPVFSTNRGELGGRITTLLTPPAADDTAAAMPLLITLLQRLNIDARAFADKNLLEQALLESTPPQKARQILKGLLAQKLLLLQDGRYTVKAHYGPQRFTINGQPAPGLLSALGGP